MVDSIKQLLKIYQYPGPERKEGGGVGGAFYGAKKFFHVKLKT